MHIEQLSYMYSESYMYNKQINRVIGSSLWSLSNVCQSPWCWCFYRYIFQALIYVSQTSISKSVFFFIWFIILFVFYEFESTINVNNKIIVVGVAQWWEPHTNVAQVWFPETRRHMWVEFIGSLLCTLLCKRLISGYFSFSLSSKTKIWFDLC